MQHIRRRIADALLDAGRTLDTRINFQFHFHDQKRLKPGKVCLPDHSLLDKDSGVPLNLLQVREDGLRVFLVAGPTREQERRLQSHPSLSEAFAGHLRNRIAQASFSERQSR